jgi:hypothetical protein
MSQSISRLSKVLYNIINSVEITNFQIKTNLFNTVHDFHFEALLQNLQLSNKISELENRITQLEMQNEDIMKNKKK